MIIRLEKQPELSFKIRESYFDSIDTLVKARALYENIDGWYHRSVAAPDLNMEFMKDEDCKFSRCQDIMVLYCQKPWSTEANRCC